MTNARDTRYDNSPPTQHPRVRGRCPSCGSESLFLGTNGYVTCSVIGCKDPGAPTDILAAGPPALDAAEQRGAGREGCVNCGEANDGGYMTGGEGIHAGNVGPFCSQCWEFVREHFHEIEPSSPPQAESSMQEGS